MRTTTTYTLTALTALLAGACLFPVLAQPVLAQTGPAPLGLFATADQCMSCHNQLTAPTGEEISMGFDWRSSMMANAARDPYWQAAIRREVMDHPERQALIEDECSACHMPMARFLAKAAGSPGQAFAHLPVATTPQAPPLARLAADGVSCTLCHQIQPDKLGTEESFTAGFVVDTATPPGQRPIFGPFQVDAGRRQLMRSATRFEPAQAAHVQSSQLCASCHTLYTHALGPGGEVIGELPEQVPYLEWLHSDYYRSQRSCQSCHMPEVTGETPVTGVMGQPRPAVSRHVFRGGNFFMPRIFNRHAGELGVQALPQELETAALRTRQNLETSAARVRLEEATVREGRLTARVEVTNLAGHKLPSAYPSRRAWLRLTVRDGGGETAFESGAPAPDGSIAGNLNDADPDRYEPHWARIEEPEQVQVYEAILAGPDGGVTTGLLTATRYVKDNRLLPAGFDKATAEPDVAVQGEAASDADFQGGGDRVVYSVDVSSHPGPFTVEAELWYQPIAYRWARNLAGYDAAEPRRFVAYYDELAGVSGVVLARDSATVR